MMLTFLRLVDKLAIQSQWKICLWRTAMNMNLCKLKDFHFAKFCLLFKKLSLSLLIIKRKQTPLTAVLRSEKAKRENLDQYSCYFPNLDRLLLMHKKILRSLFARLVQPDYRKVKNIGFSRAAEHKRINNEGRSSSPVGYRYSNEC